MQVVSTNNNNELGFKDKKEIIKDNLVDLTISFDPDNKILEHETVKTVIDYFSVVCEFDEKKTKYNKWYLFREFNCNRRQVERTLFILLSHKKHVHIEYGGLAENIMHNIRNSFCHASLFNYVLSTIVNFALDKYVEKHREKDDPPNQSDWNSSVPFIAEIPF